MDARPLALPLLRLCGSAGNNAYTCFKIVCYLIVWCTVEGGGIQVAVALVAAQAVLVEQATLGGSLLSLENFALATILTRLNYLKIFL